MTNTAKIYPFLMHLPMFQVADTDDVKQLAAQADMLHVSAKHLLFKVGDPCDGFYILMYGRVKLSIITPKALEKPLQIMQAGECFGDITMFLNLPYYLQAETLEDCALIFLPRDAILTQIKQNGSLALRMLGSLSIRMRQVVDDIEAFSLQPPAARLVTYLIRLLPPDSVQSAHIQLQVKKNIIAAQLNIAPETLSRYFRELTNRGLITLIGNTVTVHDIDALGEYMSSINNSSKFIIHD